MSLTWSLYRGGSRLAGWAAPALAGIVPADERATWRERLGHPGATVGAPEAWIHAASMGEAVAAAALRDALRAARPAARFFLTATTRTGRERLARLDPGVALAPLDTPQAASAFFAAVRPRLLLLLETELWPQWLLEARRRAVPVAVVSARLSARSLRSYGWLGPPLRSLVAGLAAVLCQTERDAELWRALGARAERTAVAGNLKFDALPQPAADRGVARAGLGLDAARPLLVLASLRPGEGRRLAAAWNALPVATREHWQVTAVPRHPHASRRVRAEAEQAGAMVVAGGAPPPGAWRWDDRPGVLAGWYAAADAAFVGGSLAPFGGHNPLEPAAAGAAVMIGPHHGSQEPAMEVLRGASAVMVTDERQLAESLRSLLEDEPERRRLADAGRAAAQRARGAAGRAVDRLREWGLWTDA